MGSVATSMRVNGTADADASEEADTDEDERGLAAVRRAKKRDFMGNDKVCTWRPASPQAPQEWPVRAGECGAPAPDSWPVSGLAKEAAFEGLPMRRSAQ
jgi:hypothetical protein